jgi:hypothetical protein
MGGLRNVDVFVKPRHDLRSKSAVGGFVTLIAGGAAFCLFLAQIYLYIAGVTRHSLHLSESRSIPMFAGQSTDPFVNRMFEIKGKIPLKIHVTFPHLKCDMLEVKLDSAELTQKDFDPKGRKWVEKRKPNPVELKAAGVGTKHKDGCTIRTLLRIPIVAGHVTVTLTRNAWFSATQSLMQRSQQSDEESAANANNNFNVSHYIHSIQFGKPFPLAAANPLEDRAHHIQNRMGGVALENIQVKLVPTVYKRMFSTQNTYQLSVVDHTVQPETLVAAGVPLLPGLSLGYDVTPLAVHHVEGRDNIFVFMSSLISIVGGVFVTVGMFAGCLAHSAQAVSKKVD